MAQWTRATHAKTIEVRAKVTREGDEVRVGLKQDKDKRQIGLLALPLEEGWELAEALEEAGTRKTKPSATKEDKNAGGVNTPQDIDLRHAQTLRDLATMAAKMEPVTLTYSWRKEGFIPKTSGTTKPQKIELEKFSKKVNEIANALPVAVRHCMTWNQETREMQIKLDDYDTAEVVYGRMFTHTRVTLANVDEIQRSKEGTDQEEADTDFERKLRTLLVDGYEAIPQARERTFTQAEQILEGFGIELATDEQQITKAFRPKEPNA